jgi:hypothetical protein
VVAVVVLPETMMDIQAPLLPEMTVDIQASFQDTEPHLHSMTVLLNLLVGIQEVVVVAYYYRFHQSYHYSHNYFHYWFCTQFEREGMLAFDY